MDKVNSKIKTPRPGTGTGKPVKYPPVDFAAALVHAPHRDPRKKRAGQDDIDLSAAVPKTQPGGTTSQPPPPQPSTNINNTLLGGNAIVKENQFNIKDVLTAKELKFLENFISGDLTIEEAMVLAGYGNLSQRYIYQIAQKTIRKYENSGPEAKKVFRDIGFGELSVAKGIKRLAQDGKSEVVQLNAYALAAKCLQMTQEAPALQVGFQVVVRCSQEEEALAPGRVRPATIWLKEQEKQEESSD